MVHKFLVLLKSELFRVTTSDDAQIQDVFRSLKSEYHGARRILGRISTDQCDYYKLKNPVYLRPGRVPADIVPECLDENNWEKVHPVESLEILAQSLSSKHVYIVIKPQEDETERAIADLNRDYRPIFSRLQIRVSTLQRWTMDDVTNNMASGRLYPPDSIRPGELSQIEVPLAQRRTYKVPSGPWIRDYQNARHYDEHFDNIFELTVNQSGAVTDREFVAFFNVLRCFDKDSDSISADSSSALKTSNFIVYFIVPPFFSRRSNDFKLKQEMPWNFPIFIDTDDQPNVWCQFHPRSDFMVSSPLFGFPFLVCEVISQRKEEDRYRMLLQAITVARAGQFLMVDGAPKPFFVVAIYLCANLTAERYVITHTTPTEEGQEDRQVSIAQKDFDLTTADGAVTFLREMYNLVAMLEELANHLDKRKQDSLVKVGQAASKMISITSKAKQDRTGGSTLSEDDGDEESQDDLGIFGTDDIQAILKKMNYKINFIPVGHPLIASVSNATSTHEPENGYLKFVKEGGKEIEILQYLTGIDSPANHTISGIRIWPVRGGNVISMPVAGGWLTSLTKPSAHLWSVATQLFEAVGFMHQHGVAHMDLKPNNILIPLNGGRLTVIDFNGSLRVKGVEHKFRGVVGTPEYIAPEVATGNGAYSAIRADLWSCGKTLEELCDKCRPSTDRDTLLEISWQLMDEDPTKRPMMTEVLDRLTRSSVDDTTRPGSSSFFVALQEVRA